MSTARESAAPLPQTGEQQCNVAIRQLENLRGHKLLSCRASPYAQFPHPNHRSNGPVPIDPSDSHRKTIPMTLYHSACVREALDGLHELVAMPRGGRVEIKRIGMANVSFGDEIGKHQ